MERGTRFFLLHVIVNGSRFTANMASRATKNENSVIFFAVVIFIVSFMYSLKQFNNFCLKLKFLLLRIISTKVINVDPSGRYIPVYIYIFIK